ncbi:zinc-binding dehydrogenase [Sorangium sp. So ce388]|uniref:zinc-binding dehydrogenase n=1 Tax=Sorangium sp. So ce388 TaxID=3133309 RepID=UPI003F5B07DD
MRAIHLTDGHGPEALTLVELPDPVPGPGGVVVRMRAASLNNRDLLLIDGTYAPFRRPFIPLSDGAGEVVATGAGVARVAPGAREASFDLTLAMRRVVTLRAASAGSSEDLEGLVRALASGNLRPPVDQVMPWTEVRAAVARMRERRHVGKIVLRFGAA